ncbi:hypothetical protein ACIQU1_18415 [Streptomyces angustmyceticus]|uniref:hypothetical protein n=1 Tax=Streptomyces angustmyceticus TaxID=285578 RepID=UPI00344DF9B9
MMTNAKIGVALVGGYLLGRTKKAKMAIGLGLFLAGKKLNLDPRQLGTLVANSPVLGPLNDQVRKELVDATKSAAGAALTQRMNGLADSLHERTLALDEGGTGGTGRAADDRDAESEDEPRDEAADGDAADSPDAESEKPAPRRRTSAKSSADSATKSATKSASATKSTATDRSAKARRTASSATKASGKAASSRGRTSTAPGRKAASGARNKAAGKASGAARTATDRGGRHA